MGPQGIPGPQGAAATIGSVECSTRTISAGDSASVAATVEGTGLRFSFEIPQGAVGAQGPKGEKGSHGDVGPQGPQGPQGESGATLTIRGRVLESSYLPDPDTVPLNTAYIVGLANPPFLYVVVSENGTRSWTNVGYMTPQAITVDDALSDVSANPVQNKVVTSAINSLDARLTPVETRSLLNEGKINEIRNVDLPNIYYELADLKEIVFETVAAVAAYVVDPAAFFVTPSYITIDSVAYPVIDDTDAEVAEIIGSTVVWNQHVRNGNFASTDYWTAEGSTFSVSSNVATFTASSQYGSIKQSLYGLKGGHKYALFAMVRTTTATDSVAINLFRNLSHQVFTAASTEWQAMKSLIEIETDGNGTLYVTDNRAADWDAVYVRSVVIVDVTDAIPTNTPTSVDDDRVQRLIQYALANPAYAENALLDFKIDSITSRGFNQWDETVEIGALYSDGYENDSVMNQLRSDFIEVLPDETYYVCSKNEFPVYVRLYDKDKHPIGSTWNYPNIKNATFNTTSETQYIRLLLTSDYGTTYNHDICINVSNASLNGRYKPYRESSIDWESVIPDDEDRTARSAGTARDVIYVRDDGNDTFSIVKRTVIWTYTFTGNESWTARTAGTNCDYYVTVSGFLPEYAEPNNQGGSICSNGYQKGNAYSGNEAGLLYVDAKRIYISVPTGANPNTIFTNGVKINYELYAKQETVLASGLLYDQISFLIEKGGTIAVNGGMPDALPGVEIDIPVKRFNE